ncbi:LptE family protein [Daejeonella sp.]|uniref:LptE family protein n=1 Tax=Daejeonella sp. TaxID=2805397 RepID=UPI00272F212D|nr:LptE family protein [Daejeonella sp.]MDP2414411.1 LptE family protein [Daejeonella sp.]
MQKILSKFRYCLIIGLVLLSQSCGTYSFSGASIPAEMKTVSVQFFENTSALVVPNLSQQFTERLKTRIRDQSRLSIIRSDADANFEGRITDYTIRPVSIQGNDRAGLNRMTVTVMVKYTNALNPELNFEQSFQAFQEFSTSQRPVQAQEQDLLKLINTQLTEDIFNKAFANW